MKIVYKWFCLAISILLAVGIVAFNAMYMPFSVSGHSMEPNFHNHELVLGQRYHLSLFNIPTPITTFTPKKDDIIVGHINEKVYGRDLHDNIIKRVIATPGQTVEVNNQQVFVNSKSLPEFYKQGINYYNNSDGSINNDVTHPKYIIKEKMHDNGTLSGMPITAKLNSHEIWVMGDNRNNSSDSRVFGPLDLQGNIHTKTCLVAKVIKTNLSFDYAYIEEAVLLLIGINLGLFYYLDRNRDQKPKRNEINTF